jgi:hypothetical protein
MQADISETAREFLSRLGIEDKTIQSSKQIKQAKEKGYSIWFSRHKHNTALDGWGQHSITLQRLEQEGFVHYIGTLQLGVADSLCRVPSLPLNTTSTDIALRTLARRIDNYQRVLQYGERLDGVNNFLSTGPSVVTPLILHIPADVDPEVARIDTSGGDARLIIDLQKVDYIAQHGWDVDEDQGVDHRPIDLVDGQHRTRGTGLSGEAMATEIPFILLSGDVDDQRAGKFFAEINVQSEPLPELHKLHLRYVMALPSHKPTQDFGIPSDAYLNGESRTKTDGDRYANRTAYEIAARLHTEEISPLKGLIKFIESEEVPGISPPIDSKKWVGIVRTWVAGLFNPRKLRSNSKGLLYEHVLAYFTALRDIARTDPHTGEPYANLSMRDPWGFVDQEGKGRDPASSLFKKAVFQVLMELFPQAYSVGLQGDFVREPSLKERYTKVLEPLIPLDFCDTKNWKEFEIEAGKKYLYQWLAWAILAGKRGADKPDPAAVWNPDDRDARHSAAGTGLFSPINPSHFAGTIRVDMKSTTELLGTTIELTTDALPNESVVKSISIEYGFGDAFKAPQVRTTKKGYQTLNRPPDDRPQPNRDRPGSAFARQTFGTSTQNGEVHADRIKIRWSSGNLFNQTVDLFERVYTLDDLRKMNGNTVLLAREPFSLDYIESEDDVELLNLGDATDLTHVVVDHELKDEDDYIEEVWNPLAEEIHSEEHEPEDPNGADRRQRVMDDIANQLGGIAPKPLGSWNYERNARNRWDLYRNRPQYCNFCFHGIDHKCWNQ